MARWKRSTDIAVSPVGADATADMTMDEQPRRANRLLDLALGVAGLLVAVPVAIGAALAMRASGDRGPLLYRAQRVGEHGREVTVFKLRSMRVGAAGLPITSSDDDRITPVGRFLRRYKLDELPQFFNVVRGDMSVVGPRPEDRSYVDWTDPLHRFVFSARPGITGPSQLAFRHEERLLVVANPDSALSDRGPPSEAGDGREVPSPTDGPKRFGHGDRDRPDHGRSRLNPRARSAPRCHPAPGFVGPARRDLPPASERSRRPAIVVPCGQPGFRRGRACPLLRESH